MGDYPIGLQYGDPGPTPSGIEHGTDIETPEGTALYAPVAGEVVYSGNNPVTGGTIGIYSGGLYYWFGHLKQLAAGKGQTLMVGEPLGLTGGKKGDPMRGDATGPHLWVGVSRGPNMQDLINPASYINQQAMFEGSGSGAVSRDLVPPFAVGSTAPPKPVAEQGIGPFKFPIVSYGKVIGGFLILLIALVIIVAAMGLRGGMVTNAAESAPVVGPVVKATRRRQQTRVKQTLRREQASSTRAVRANKPKGQSVDAEIGESSREDRIRSVQAKIARLKEAS